VRLYSSQHQEEGHEEENNQPLADGQYRCDHEDWASFGPANVESVTDSGAKEQII